MEQNGTESFDVQNGSHVPHEEEDHLDLSAAAETLGSLDSRRASNNINMHLSSLHQVISSEPHPSTLQQIANQLNGPPPVSAHYTEWNQREWNDFIQDILVYLNEKEPVNDNLFHTERQLIPDGFDRSPSGIYCYPFKGVFLPTGHADGRVWKPSQGAKPTGNFMMKRYFYNKDTVTGMKTKRQVSWLVGREHWCFIEYRNENFKGKFRLDDLISCGSNIDWPLLLNNVRGHTYQRENYHIPIEKFQREKRKKISPISDSANMRDGTSEAIKRARSILREYGVNIEQPMESKQEES